MIFITRSNFENTTWYPSLIIFDRRPLIYKRITSITFRFYYTITCDALPSITIWSSREPYILVLIDLKLLQEIMHIEHWSIFCARTLKYEVLGLGSIQKI